MSFKLPVAHRQFGSAFPAIMEPALPRSKFVKIASILIGATNGSVVDPGQILDAYAIAWTDDELLEAAEPFS